MRGENGMIQLGLKNRSWERNKSDGQPVCMVWYPGKGDQLKLKSQHSGGDIDNPRSIVRQERTVGGVESKLSENVTSKLCNTGINVLFELLFDYQVHRCKDSHYLPPPWRLLPETDGVSLVMISSILFSFLPLEWPSSRFFSPPMCLHSNRCPQAPDQVHKHYGHWLSVFL